MERGPCSRAKQSSREDWLLHADEPPRQSHPPLFAGATTRQPSQRPEDRAIRAIEQLQPPFLVVHGLESLEPKILCRPQ